MRLKRLIVIVCVSLAASSCTTPGVPPVPGMDQGPRPKIALVLGGGAARGFAHVGVIRALEQERIPIDLIVGTSVGSLIGAIYANDLNSFELEWTAFSLEKEHLFDYGLLTAFTGMGPVKGDKLEEFVRSKVPAKDIEQLKIPFAAVATDLNRGTRVVLDTGPVARAVRASCSIPGIFQPVNHQGKMLVDGGVVDNIPIDVAREKGADIIIAVDISEHLVNFNIVNVVDVVIQATNIMFSENVKNQKQGADVLIRPRIGDVSTLDFTQKKRCMQAGMEATQQMMPAVRAKIAEWQQALARK